MPKLIIDRLDGNGLGVARYKNRLVRVAYVIPGEEVYVKKVDKRRINYPTRILNESSERVTPLCPFFGLCGGCRLQHMKYSAQLKLKEETIYRLFYEFDVEKFDKILPSPKIFHYRNKMEFVFAERFGDLILGLRMFGSFKTIIDLSNCFLQKEEANEAMLIIKRILRKRMYKPYNLITHKGFLRYLVIRTSFKEKGMLINVVTTSENILNIEEIYEALISEFESISVYWSVNDTLSDVAYGDIKRNLGLEFIQERILNFRFRIYPYTFFQTNPLQAERLYNIVRKKANGGNTALDVYSGIGTIGIIVSDKYDIVYGIESMKESIQSAWLTAKDNDINNINFIHGKAEDKLKEFVGKNVDTIIFDPPRAGLSKQVIKSALEIKPNQIIYISCNPRTQVRDLRYFVEKGYVISYVRPVDMFPHTPHIESIVVLEKK